MAHAKHHRRHRGRKVSAWTLLAVALGLCVVAGADFAHQAHQTNNCFVSTPDPTGQSVSRRSAVDSEECRVAIPRRDAHFWKDGLAVLCAAALAIGAVLMLSHARQRTLRLVLAAEIAVIVRVVFYSLLWNFTPVH